MKIKSVNLSIATVISIITLIFGCKRDCSYDFKVEGLYYLDNKPVEIGIKDGKISYTKRIKKISDGASSIIVAPGLIDNQVNGYKGHSFVNTGKDLSLEDIKDLTHAFWEVGTTTFLPTLTTNDHNIFLRNFELLAKVKEDPSIRGSIAGFHLEGPYISPSDGYRGAHPLKYVRKPNWDEFMQLYNASERNILQVSLAPEIEGAMDFITKCKELEIKVGIVHHNASPNQINEAINRGAAISIHLGNGLANYIHRWNNPLWPQLADDRLDISMICDGYHLTPEQIRVYYKTKGPDKIIMTSDMSPFGGLTPGFYLNAIGDTLELKEEGVVMYPAQNSLSGSATPLSKMIGYVMNVTNCNLANAIKMASTNPAKLYGLDDRGLIEPGRRADLILFTVEDFSINIRKTIVAGEIVYESSK